MADSSTPTLDPATTRGAAAILRAARDRLSVIQDNLFRVASKCGDPEARADLREAFQELDRVWVRIHRIERRLDARTRVGMRILQERCAGGVCGSRLLPPARAYMAAAGEKRGAGAPMEVRSGDVAVLQGKPHLTAAGLRRVAEKLRARAAAN